MTPSPDAAPPAPGAADDRLEERTQDDVPSSGEGNLDAPAGREPGVSRSRGRGPRPSVSRAAVLAGLAPAVPPALALAVFIVWIPSHVGLDLGAWAPGGLVFVALLALSALAVPWSRGHPRRVWVALGALGAFTAWSYASIAWASDKGDAWDGANRTLLYLLVFALFALWRQSEGAAAGLLGGWTLAVGIAALVVLVGLPADGHGMFKQDRLLEPAGYQNANAALWLMALWPAVVLASRAEVPWWLRGALGGFAVVLADVSLLSQSRGSVIASAVCAVLLFVLVPRRVRLLAAVLPVAVGVGVTAPGVLHAVRGLNDPATAGTALAGVAGPVLVAALAVALVLTVWAALERFRPAGPELARRTHRVAGAAGLAGTAAALVLALVLVGNPATRVQDAWHSFKQGYTSSSAAASHLVSGLGSNRYDFYRVSLDLLADHPVAGVGADNFQQDYLVRGRSPETPHYPHSVEMRTLAQTGLVGAALLLLAVGAGLSGAWRAMRRRPGLGGAVAGGAALGFLYWLAHGSADWLWEYAGLGAPAWALLGLACGQAPSRNRDPEAGAVRAGGAPLARGPLRVALVVALALVGLVTLGAPWLAQREYTAAGHAWTTDPARAYRLLDAARRLNPLSDRPDDLAATIALRQGDARVARLAFTAAAARNPRSSYAALGLGAIASSEGDRPRAAMLLARAAALDPRDEVTRAVRAEVDAGRRVSLRDFDHRLFVQSQAFVQ